MRIDIKRAVNLLKDPSRLFTGVVAITMVAWLVWLLFTSFGPIEVQVKRTTQPIPSVDQKAYRESAEYVDLISTFQLPNFGEIYSNPEPFREY